MDSVIFWTLLAFLAGSIPFSVWLGYLFTRKDVRTLGDGNPGGWNAWIAGGFTVGLTVGLLDMFKGFIPVSLAIVNGVSDWGIVPVAIAPVLGHAFSPFLRFRGGKAVAATLGVWMALIGANSWIAYAVLALISLAVQTENAWSAIAGMLGLGFYLWLTQSPIEILAAWAGNFLIMLHKHRNELRLPPPIRPWASNLFVRRGS
jgi:glycerol-3-phosphate acyltransferase PlsY